MIPAFIAATAARRILPTRSGGPSVFPMGLTIYCVTMTPATTLSIILREPRGKPELAPMPTEAPGAGEVLLRIEACSEPVEIMRGKAVAP